MNRAEYSVARRKARTARECREDRGLPHHPTYAWFSCPNCEGHGRFSIPDASGDPYWETDVACERCDGKGGWHDQPYPRDPLLEMRAERRYRHLSWRHRDAYSFARVAAMRPARGQPRLVWSARHA